MPVSGNMLELSVLGFSCEPQQQAWHTQLTVASEGPPPQPTGVSHHDHTACHILWAAHKHHTPWNLLQTRRVLDNSVIPSKVKLTGQVLASAPPVATAGEPSVFLTQQLLTKGLNDCSTATPSVAVLRHLQLLPSCCINGGPRVTAGGRANSY
jgi:hypothetical protein